jgi:excisionase family DNA binding protein
MLFFVSILKRGERAMLTSTKVGKALGLTKATICTLARDGRIPFIQLPSGHRRFDLEEVKKALSSDATASTFLFPVEKGGA